VLVGRNRSVGRRVAGIFLATGLVTAVGLLAAGLLAVAGLIAWPPRPSSPFGVILGFVLLGFVFFEMALLPRKWFRGWRLGATKVWMWLHVWVGLAGIPVVLLHAGFGLGGPLPAVTLILFLATTASGIWGLVMQQWLPTKMIAEIPGETVASQVDFTGAYHAKEVERLVRVVSREVPERVIVIRGAADTHLGATGTDLEDAELVGPPARDMIRFLDMLTDYLSRGRRSAGPLRSRAEAERRFGRLRADLPVETHEAIGRMEQLADLRRQWDGEVRINFWLHNWLVVHLPLSVGMTVLMLVHAARALKYW
jgi:hypothetical protein